ncbi:unnamed protein product [Gulo gulo]|uniref:Uncharacterized protein n=1 Tax=Gulo gulo TaxID=48420 RepID=A0A9X9Q204_GULGU|nr:unnamed protein product [Gulo gulo]
MEIATRWRIISPQKKIEEQLLQLSGRMAYKTFASLLISSSRDAI